jgi:hypothetical protein
MFRATSLAMNRVIPLLVASTVGCTQLGPMPATTAISNIPSGRPGVELTAGSVPGYFLSAGTQDDPDNASMPQASLTFEPDRLIGVPGIYAGVRGVGGNDSDAYAEPLLGYRLRLDRERRFSAGAALFATGASDDRNGASYSMTRGGAELGGDVRVTPESDYAELHLSLGASVVGVDADGKYCLGIDGRYGVDCPDAERVLTAASVSGWYPALNTGLSIDFGRDLRGAFHGGRLAFLFSTGTQPRLVAAEQVDPEGYTSFGLSLSLGFGAFASKND